MTKQMACASFLLMAFGISSLSWSGIVSGVIKSDKGRLVNHARIKAWDKDPTSKSDLLGKTMTNKKGRYSIRYKQKRWDGVSGGPAMKSNSPDVFISVEIKVRGKWELIATSAVRKDQLQSKPLRINMSNVNRRNAFVRRTIYGIIKNKKGKVQRGVTVEAWDKDWGKNAELMGKTETNQHGHYRISYTARRWDGFQKGFSLGKSANPDIFITVTKKKSKGSVAKSTVFKNHPINKKLKINLRFK